MEDEKIADQNSKEAKISGENSIISLDPLPRRRILAVEENGTEHFEPFQAYNEKLLSLLQRVDFGKVVEEDAKESKLVQEWEWKGLYENVKEAQMELGYMMDFIAHVQTNIEVDIIMANRPKQTAEEVLKDRAICLMTKLQSFNVFAFLFRGIDAVKVIGIGENFLQISLSPKTALSVRLEYALSNKENDSVGADMEEGDSGHSKGHEYGEHEGNETIGESRKNKVHQMDVDTKLYESEMLSESEERYPNPLSSELYLEQIVHQNTFGSHSIRDTVMPRKAGADLRVGTGRGQSNTINVLEHFCTTLIHRIYSYKVLDVLEKMVQLHYLRLVSHPTWKADTSAWFLFLAIPEIIRHRDQTEVLIDAQKNVRSRYYSKIVVHKELLTIEAGPIPCIGGLFTGASTEVRSTNEFSCGLADLASFLLHQVGSQIIYWLHEEVAALRYKVKRDFLCLSFKISESHVVSLVATPNVQEYNINWSLKVENIMLDDALPTSSCSSIELESQFLGPLNLESLYEVVINMVILYKIL